MENCSVPRIPQHLNLPLLYLPQAIVVILDKINIIQGCGCVRCVFGFKRVFRSNMIRDGERGHGSRVCAVFQLNADIADVMRGGQDKNYLKEVVDLERLVYISWGMSQ
jgi:hypothetical protein